MYACDMGASTGAKCIVLAAAVSLLAGCDGDPSVLAVDVRTDLVPGVEFTRVRSALDSGGPGMITMDAASAIDQDFVAGQRVAEYEALSAGTYRLVVELLEADGRVALSRPVSVTFDGTSLGVTVVLTRDCRGVVCPEGGDPSATACLGGRCVSPECSAEQLERCGTPECTAIAECPLGAACASVSCESGACLLAPRNDQCAASEYCDPEVGCRPRPGAGDSGPSDGGTDADAAPDGSIDAGPTDAAVDSALPDGDAGSSLFMVDMSGGDVVITSPGRFTLAFEGGHRYQTGAWYDLASSAGDDLGGISGDSMLRRRTFQTPIGFHASGAWYRIDTAGGELVSVDTPMPDVIVLTSRLTWTIPGGEAEALVTNRISIDGHWQVTVELSATASISVDAVEYAFTSVDRAPTWDEVDTADSFTFTRTDVTPPPSISVTKMASQPGAWATNFPGYNAYFEASSAGDPSTTPLVLDWENQI